MSTDLGGEAGTYCSERGIQRPVAKTVLQKDIKLLLDKPRNHNPAKRFKDSHMYQLAANFKKKKPNPTNQQSNILSQMQTEKELRKICSFLTETTSGH